MRGSSPYKTYFFGFAAALVLTCAAYGAVVAGGIGRSGTLALVTALAAAQIIVHLRFFLHLDLSDSKREDLQLVLFAALLIGLMVAGTFWVMTDLAGRMMPRGLIPIK